jgi:hypothetical protein
MSRHDDDDELQDHQFDVIPDGGSVRVGMLVMDSVQRSIAFDARNHQPHYATPLDHGPQHDKAAARMQWIKQTCDAWKSPAQRSMVDSTTPAPDARRNLNSADAQSLRNAVYDQMCQRISAAWQVRPQDQAPDDPYEADPNEANLIEQQRKQVTAEDLERQRRKIHSDFSQRLSEAWRGGR